MRTKCKGLNDVSMYRRSVCGIILRRGVFAEMKNDVCVLRTASEIRRGWLKRAKRGLSLS